MNASLIENVNAKYRIDFKINVDIFRARKFHAIFFFFCKENSLINIMSIMP